MHPIFVQFGDFYIAWYGVFVALAIIGGASMSAWLAHRQGVDINVVLDVLLIVVISLIVGARFFYIVTVWPEFVADPWPHLFSRTGFVFLGGLIGATLGATIYVWRRQLPVWRLGDIAAPAIPLGHGIGRIGCHFTGCCHGGVCPPGWESWGLRVPPAEIVLEHGGDQFGQIVGGYAYFEHLADGLIAEGAATSLPVWPIQLVAAAANILLAAFLLRIYFRRRWNGQAFLSYFLLYGALRFVLEIFRGDSGRGVHEFGGLQLSFSQGLGIGIVALAAIGYVLGRKGLLPAQDKPFPIDLIKGAPEIEPSASSSPDAKDADSGAHAAGQRPPKKRKSKKARQLKGSNR